MYPHAPYGSFGFNGRGYAVGMIRGVRAFGVLHDGRLTGASYQQVWEPGINRAVCLLGESMVSLRHHQIAGGRWPDPEADTHDFLGCRCGFWSYWGRDHVPHANGQTMLRSGQYVLGVIEGYFRVAVGEKGFRASRAMLVAVCVPAEVATRHEDDDVDTSLIASRYRSVAVFTDPDRMLAEYPPDGSAVGVDAGVSP